MKYVIIGGVAAGASAATRLRRLDERAEIVILEKSGYVSYANCGLPYYIGGVIDREQKLTVQTPQSLRQRFAIDVRVRHETMEIDPARKRVAVKDQTGQMYEQSYDKLLLATGAAPRLPDIPGSQLPGVFTLRHVEDALAIGRLAREKSAGTALVVGGGYIGVEMAENLVHAGWHVTLVQRPRQVLPPLDYDMACLVHDALRRGGVDLRLGTQPLAFTPRQEGGVCAQLSDGESVCADLVVLALGVVPDSALARQAGLEIGEKGAIVVNRQMETSVPDIYAAGDAVEICHRVTGKKALISLAGPANKQGRIAADNMAGRPDAFAGAVGSSVVQVFDVTVAATGLSERAALAQGMACQHAITFSLSHAGYYPGGSAMTVKTMFDPESGRILGAQIVGGQGVDKRIDVLATALFAGLDAKALTQLDLAYAPPYSSAKDPVNMAGYVIENLRQGLVRQFDWDQVAALERRDDVTLLDVRTEEEFARGHFAGARSIPLDELRERLDELDPDKLIYVNCQSGLRSYLACRILSQNGFSCWHLAGGYGFWRRVQEETSPRR